MEWLSLISNFLWKYVLSALLIFVGLFFTVRLKFFQIRHFGHILNQTAGQIFKKDKQKGSITPFQAFTSSLASTAGATNIVGVPVGIYLGGPGALFWMWIIALIGMATKYGEIAMGLKYREKNKEGIWVGGPQYYIRKALGWKRVAFLFAFILMLELIPSIMVQSNSITTQVQGAFGWDRWVTGLIITAIVGVIVFGGIKRIANVTDKVVPFMVLTYLTICLIVIGANFTELPSVFNLIFNHAFTPISATGGFAGAGFALALRWGIARGLYSNEAGLGTAPITHSAAQTDHPSKQAFWGVFSVFIDTIIICTVSGLTVLVTGAWTKVDSSEEASNMIDIALSTMYGDTFGGGFISLFLLFFVLTTIGVLVFFGEKQAEYLYGLKASWIMRFVYIVSIFVGGIGGLEFVWQFLDLMLAAVVVFNVIPLFFMRKEIIELTDDYFSRVYKGKDTKPKITLFHDQDPPSM